MIPFNKPCLTGNEEKYILESIKSDKISGDGKFTGLWSFKVNSRNRKINK